MLLLGLCGETTEWMTETVKVFLESMWCAKCRACQSMLSIVCVSIVFFTKAAVIKA